jgi:hypothetical protein
MEKLLQLSVSVARSNVLVANLAAFMLPLLLLPLLD